MVRALRALGCRAAAGNFRGGRERPPYNPPQMGAGKRNVSRKGKVPGFACRLLCIVGRAISPAGQHSDGRKVCGTVRALLPREGKGVAWCRTPPPPAAHSPSGLRCPHRTARAEARLCSATAAPAPSRFLRRRRRSTPQPLAGEALQAAAPQRLPCKGSRHRASDDGGVHCHPVLQISCRVVTAGRPAGRCRHCRPLKIPQPRPKAAPQFPIPDFQLLIFKTGSAGRRRRRRAAFWAPPCAGARRPGG